jgi:hypothetical protein
MTNQMTRRLLHLLAVATPAALACGTSLPSPAQSVAQAVPTGPVNDRPNPYETVEGWAKMPAGRT